ncbi:MAG TPA: gamma-glutamylcyclotransferase [Methylomusa anaerophila]|uniref:AIG2-like family protein n=1 Tax=Methylomusa anaerophila TaxID=1930071 RepID=A0A348AFE0_9FIRM|nr:gamma-glutamylcyclotransferase family protein [Methylomusa anaerophila]BBB89788.1 hypothetical protein MAMMFC1_00422 [Methylomusa anaerophila]HML89166.1 gamma-glutamylcyclotransferase [Methylomusa anaerophila]
MRRRKFRHYFAYGINMNNEQVRQIDIHPQVLNIARLPGYRLGFYGYSAIWDGAVETIVADTGAELWGVLYALDFAECERLDEWMDARVDGAGNYFHYPVTVVDGRGRIEDALIYKKSSLGNPKPPSAQYLDAIIRGAREKGLPAEYVMSLQSVASQPASYTVPRYPWAGKERVLSEECKICTDLIEKNRMAWLERLG